MKRLLGSLLIISLCSFSIWQPDMATARKIAKEKHRLILLNFSGSDWCGPCIQMKKTIFESKVFEQMADTSLVMVNADFPRLNKNQLPFKKMQQNRELADRYNTSGVFPFTVLLDEDGNLIKSWTGLPMINAAQFTNTVKSLCDAYHK
jgi:thioredoxin-related protein